MTSYEISGRATGHILGTYEGETVEEALDAMARDAGYRSYAAMADTLGQTVEQARADVRVTEVG